MALAKSLGRWLRKEQVWVWPVRQFASVDITRTRRKILEEIGQDLGVKKLSDWYSIPVTSVARHPKGNFLRNYNSSLYLGLQKLHPEHHWQPWLFKNTVKGVWSKVETVVAFLRYAEDHLKLDSPAKWLGITWKQLLPLGAGKLHREGSHLAHYLRILHPAHSWDETMFVMPPGVLWWKDRSNRIRLLQEISLVLKAPLDSPSLWYLMTVQRITSSQVRHCSTLLRYYRNSLCDLLSDLVPLESPWLPWLFHNCPPLWWKSAENVRDWLGWVMLKMGLRSATELTIVTHRQWQLLRGRAVLRQHGDSVLAMLQWALPELKIQAWDLRSRSRGKTGQALSASRSSERAYLQWIAQELGISAWPDGWYTVTYETVARVAAKRGGGNDSLIASRYGFSLARALITLFPEYPWELSAFIQVGKGLWDDQGVQRAAMQRLSASLFNIEAEQAGTAVNLERWYSVTPQMLSKLDSLDALYLIARYHDSSAKKALFALFPEHLWVPTAFSSPSLRLHSYAPKSSATTKKTPKEGPPLEEFKSK